MNLEGEQPAATLNRDNISKHNKKMKGQDVEEPTEEPPIEGGEKEIAPAEEEKEES